MQNVRNPNLTSSKGTRFMGFLLLVGVPTLVLFAFFLTPEDDNMEDAVRLLYIHVPMAIFAYVAVITTGIGSIFYLWKKSRWWDTVAHASAEIGLIFCGLVLVTGSIWGRPTWNTWWEWGDVRLVTTLVLFLMLLGYLALRQVPANPDLRAKRASVVGIIVAINIPIVNRSVEWWENSTLHQQSSLTDGKLEDLTLFTLFLGLILAGVCYLWLMTHRFRVGWLQTEIENEGAIGVLQERIAEGTASSTETIIKEDGEGEVR
ncbi:MAG: cytochrome c biogenesis protein CcsA [Acidimicrobiales bacterium]|nr:cytochrome c biogenesis protein CcsA [Acidimicrobiales bacterium]MDP6298900.1 cytochrome c biogenesis protein CcsA [Acidimicrobiales bacterium]HJM27767.1 cytochrome c biogenesis protein CcsA [Acidimicrobiales bacterium]HJM96715.1 cytochrome c biogenesis protein CcsA [Acidimicrobiales bacterium]